MKLHTMIIFFHSINYTSKFCIPYSNFINSISSLNTLLIKKSTLIFLNDKDHFPPPILFLCMIPILQFIFQKERQKERQINFLFVKKKKLNLTLPNNSKPNSDSIIYLNYALTTPYDILQDLHNIGIMGNKTTIYFKVIVSSNFAR